MSAEDRKDDLMSYSQHPFRLVHYVQTEGGGGGGGTLKHAHIKVIRHPSVMQGD